MGLFDIFKKGQSKAICKCARCKKEISEDESQWIGNHRFCKSCASPKRNPVSHPQTECQQTKSDQIPTELNRTMLNNSQLEEQRMVCDSGCERCLNDLSESQVNQGQLNESISWKIVDNILYLSGNGTLTQESYLVITAPAPRYETESYSRVLPWAVCPRIRMSKYISEGCPVNGIPTHIEKFVVEGEIDGLENFLLGANNYIGVQLQSAKEYYSPTDTNDEKMNGLETLIRNDNYETWEALCLHKTTHEVYAIRGKNIFRGDMQRGGRMESLVSSISIASLEDAASIVNKEFNYLHLYAHQADCSNISHKKLTIGQKVYRIEWVVVIDNIEVPQNQILFGESVFQVPAQFLTEEQREKYAEFYTRPGPYEHCYDLPAECCQKVLRKLVLGES